MDYREYETQQIMWDEVQEDGFPNEHIYMGQMRTPVDIRTLKRSYYTIQLIKLPTATSELYLSLIKSVITVT
jgi:hypothetical protein